MSLCSHLYSLVKNLHNKFKINANWTASETFFLYLNIHGDFCVTSFRQNFTTYNATAFWNIANALWYLNHGNSVFPFWPAWIMYLQNLRPCSRSTKYPNGSQNNDLSVFSSWLDFYEICRKLCWLCSFVGAESIWNFG